MRKNKNNLSVIVICFLTGMLLSPFLIAQKPNYKFKTINQVDGLINGSIQAIYQDSFGFIWLGTHHGIQRYDGKTLKSFEQINKDTTGGGSNFIFDFCEDADKNIWMTTSKGLNKYIRKTDKIERIQWNNKLLINNSSFISKKIASDVSDANILWITSFGTTLLRVDTRNDSITVYSADGDLGINFQCILPYPGDTNKLLLGNTNLYSFDKISGRFDEIFRLEQNNDPPNNMVTAMVADPENKNVVWLSTGDIWGRGSLGGIIRYDLNTGVQMLLSSETRQGEIPDRHILSLCFYDKDNLWIGTRNSGVLLYKINEDRFYNYKNNPYDASSLVTLNAIISMMVDRSGTMWFGTWGDGISFLSPTTQKFSHFKHFPGNTTGLLDNYITSFAEDKYGDIWIGTRAGGMSKFNPVQKTFENYFQEFISDKKQTEITYLFFDNHDNLWIGTFDDALYRYNPTSNVKIHFKKGKSKNEITQKRITAITEFIPGEILISTYGGGLNIYNYQTNSFRHYVNIPGDSTSIPQNRIWLPFLGDDGNYYFGSNSFSSLFHFNPEKDNFSNTFSKGTVAGFLMPNKTQNGRIFINDVVNGLKEIKFQEEITISAVYDVNGKGVINVESILADDNNKLWMGTGNGLVEYDPSSKISKRYDTDDGLQGNEFIRFAAFKSSSGEMYFGGKNGFSVFHPDDIKLSNYKPKIVFTDFKLFQEIVEIGEKTPLKQNILLMDKLILNHDQNDFSVSFAALDFSNPHKIEYKYILENHDEDWINAGHNNVASYTNMDPGEYTLKVLATNGDGIWCNEAKQIIIIINPPWWLTNWAYGFYLLLFVIGVSGIDRFMRNRLIQKERERSRTLELEQAKEIEKAYIKLKSTQAQLVHSEKMASLGELTAGIAHEIQNPLNFVNNFSEVNAELIEELKEEIKKGDKEEAMAIVNDIAGNEEKINHHGKRADGIVKGMLQHSRTSNNEKEMTDINVLADEYLRLAYHGLRAKDKSFNADFKADLDMSLPKINVIPQDIGRVLLNLINNAFYAVSEKKKIEIEGYEPTVSVSTKRDGNKVFISVKDNGKGIPEKVMGKIFQPFYTTKPTGEGTGLGLSMSYDIITKGHGGELKVDTKEGEETKFIIQIPIDTI